MHIKHHVNPFRTQVILTDQDKKDLYFKIKIEKLHDLLSSASGYLRPGSKFYNPEKAFNQVDIHYRFSPTSDTSLFEKNVQETFNDYLEALEGSHLGDCVSAPCSCSKCAAEHLLGINTLYTMSQTVGKLLFDAFTAIETAPGFNPTTHNTGLVSAVLRKLQQDYDNEKEDHNKPYIEMAISWLTSYELVHRGVR